MDLYEEIAKIRANGERAALATIISVHGSAPRKDFAKMLIKSDGTFIGSVGGGCVEAEVWQEARLIIENEQPKVLHFKLTEKDMEESGLICGGALDIFVEPIIPDPGLFIFGAGHVAQPLAQIGTMIGFKVSIIDDREMFANKERFPSAHEIFVGEFSDIFRNLKINKSSYIVILTRGHLYDQDVLEWACRTEAKYVGMIGSRHKIKVLYKNLEEKGVQKEALQGVHAPIGLDIKAKTPEEIAVSIAAELIKVRYS
ncbi:MAG: XdhC family protein [Candidatus Tectomicrobia bacterium]|uniref:XdhC family protein n=1 Tax=Tectimicrobiota bacterium TaxID=2528274 RepID=A0A933GN09_UNCTE|nr:XdhC family protein [Candidatus Tectomicrobia bacterium]